MYKIIVIYIIYKLLNKEIIGKVINITLPFIMAFVLAYIFNPLLKKLNKRIPKIVCILIILLLFISLIFLLLWLIIPLFINETNSLIKILINYINILEIKYSINLSSLINNLYKLLDYKYIISGISYSLSFVTSFIIMFISFIYILIDIDKIELFIKKYFKNNIYNCLKKIDINLKHYLLSLIKISIISFFEYSISFFIIKHSNPLIIGISASICNLIPYVGGIIVLIIAILTSPSNIIKTSMLFLMLGLVDSYLINPFIYGKYNKIHPVLGLISASIFGYIFGIPGVILSLPLTIILLTIIDFYKKNIISYLCKVFKK